MLRGKRFRAIEPQTTAAEQHAEATPTSEAEQGAAPQAGVLQLQRRRGNRYVQRLVARNRRPSLIQARLSLRPPDDAYEAAADQAARQAVAGQLVSAQPHVTTSVPGESTASVTPELEGSITRARSGGRSLPRRLRQSLEQSFNADFGDVRVHTGQQADDLNRALQARAFTTGQDIFFRRGAYNASSTVGRELLAHELAHVVQQVPAASDQGVPTVQRLLDEDFKHGGTPTADELKACKEFAQQVSDFVDQAYNDLMAGNFKNWEGNKITTFLDLLLRKSIAALVHVGNVIEERVYALMKNHNMKLKWTPQYAEAMGGASFPDIVVNLAPDREALIDITSERGHILKKAGAWTTSKRYVYVAEAWFESVRKEYLPIILDGVTKGGLDAEEVKKRKQEAEQRRKAKLAVREKAQQQARALVKHYGSITAFARAEFAGNKIAASNWLQERGVYVKGQARRKGKRKPSEETRKLMRQRAAKERKAKQAALLASKRVEVVNVNPSKQEVVNVNPSKQEEEPEFFEKGAEFEEELGEPEEEGAEFEEELGEPEEEGAEFKSMEPAWQ